MLCKLCVLGIYPQRNTARLSHAPAKSTAHIALVNQISPWHPLCSAPKNRWTAATNFDAMRMRAPNFSSSCLSVRWFVVCDTLYLLQYGIIKLCFVKPNARWCWTNARCTCVNLPSWHLPAIISRLMVDVWFSALIFFTCTKLTCLLVCILLTVKHSVIGSIFSMVI